MRKLSVPLSSLKPLLRNQSFAYSSITVSSALSRKKWHRTTIAVGSIRFASIGADTEQAALAQTAQATASTPVDVAAIADVAQTVQAVIATAPEEPWMIVKLAHAILNGVHVVSGLPWWASIVVSTICIRTLLLPVAISTFRATGAMRKCQPAMDALKNEMEEHKKSNGGKLTTEESMYYQKKHAEVCKANGFSIGRMMAMPLVQAPVFMTFLWSVRSLPTQFDLSQGGFHWILDLGVTDPHYILPVVASIFSLVALESGGDSGGNEQASKIKPFIRALLVLCIPVYASFVAAVFFYWIPNSIFSTLLGYTVRQPAVKKMLKIPIPDPVVQDYTAKANLSAHELMNMSPLERTKLELERQRISLEMKPQLKIGNSSQSKVEYVTGGKAKRGNKAFSTRTIAHYTSYETIFK
jgi:YidC/Oxa1 family membrane protein insertase